MQKEKKKEGKVETSWTLGVEKGSIASLLHVGAIGGGEESRRCGCRAQLSVRFGTHACSAGIM